MGFSNRFDTSEKQDYIHNYTPLPFEAIGNLGAKMTQEHATKQAEADALADQLNKIKVSNQVLSEGSGEDLGIKYRNTGYGDFKNQVLNKYTLANKQLADDYQAGKLDAGQFAQKVGQLKSDFTEDYQKLKIAEANSAAIEEADKKYREAKQAGANPFILNKLAEEGSRLLSNPYGNEYKGAPIGEALDVEDVKNKYADKFKSQIFSSGAGIKDANGMIIYTDKSGVSKQRVIDSVNATFENDLIGVQTKEQTNRFLRDRGLDWNSEVTLQDGSKVKAGDYYYKSLKQDFINGVVAKAESSELKKQIKQDWILKDQMKTDKKEADKKIYTTNEQGNPEVLGIEGALNSLNLGDVLDTSGEWKNPKALDSKYTVTNIDGTVKTFDNSVDAHKFAGNTGIITQQKAGNNESADEIIGKGYAKLIAKHKELGLPQPVDATGKPTGKIKDQLYDYALSLAQSRSTTSRLQPTTIQGMNKLYLGKNSDISNMEFYTQGDKGSNAKVTNEKVNSLSLASNNSCNLGLLKALYSAINCCCLSFNLTKS